MIIVGIDEVGRGCWAGPLVAGAVLWDDQTPLPAGVAWRLTDSKQLTKIQRASAELWLQDTALAYGIGWVSAADVDTLGLTEAVRQAMLQALRQVETAYGQPERIIIDGSYNFLADISQAQAVVKADGSVAAVSAASILAKQARDRWMGEVAAKQYPGYGFDKHVGYGTPAHYRALQELGVTPLHRRSYKPVAALC